MKILKTIFKLIGALMIFGGLRHIYSHITVAQEVTNAPTTILNIINGLAYLATGYGLLRLRRWLPHALGITIVATVVTIFYNIYLSDIVPGIMSYGRIVAFLIILSIFLIFKARILEEKK